MSKEAGKKKKRRKIVILQRRLKRILEPCSGYRAIDRMELQRRIRKLKG